MPLFTATIEGKRIADVNSLTEGQTSQGTLYNGADNNPVDVLYDYLTNRRYGKGLDHDANGNYEAGLHIDIQSFKDAKALVGNYYKINGVLDTSKEIYTNIGEILESMNGMISFRNGQYFLRIKHAAQSTAMVIGDDELESQVVVTRPDKSMKLNKITAGFRNPASGTDYNDDLTIITNATYLAEDNNVILETRVDYELVDDGTLVYNLANYAVDSSRNATTISFEAVHTVIIVEPGDIIEMDLPNFGWTNKKFRVVGMELTADNTIAVQAVEYESSIELI